MKKYIVTISLCLVFSLSYAQCIEGDCQNGFGKIKYDNALYHGFFSNGKFHGFGIYETKGDTYYGEFLNGQYQGFGRYVWQGTKVYLGNYINNSQNGMGIYIDEKNQAHAYSWKDGKALNPFSTDPDEINPPNCEGNCINGYGRITYSDGSYIQAIYQNGNSILGEIASNSSTYNGFLSNNKPNGFGILSDNIGAYLGYFKNGLKHGNIIKINMLNESSFEKWNNGVLIDNIASFVMDQEKFSGDLKSILEKSKKEIQDLVIPSHNLISDELNIKFMNVFRTTFSFGFFSGDYISIYFQNDEKIKSPLNKNEINKALSKCSYLSKETDSTYTYNDKLIKVEKYNYLTLKIEYPDDSVKEGK